MQTVQWKMYVIGPYRQRNGKWKTNYANIWPVWGTSYSIWVCCSSAGFLKFLLLLLWQLFFFFFSQSQLKFRPAIHHVHFNPPPPLYKWLVTGGLWEGCRSAGGLFPWLPTAHTHYQPTTQFGSSEHTWCSAVKLLWISHFFFLLMKIFFCFCVAKTSESWLFISCQVSDNMASPSLTRLRKQLMWFLIFSRSVHLDVYVNCIMKPIDFWWCADFYCNAIMRLTLWKWKCYWSKVIDQRKYPQPRCYGTLP